MSGSWCTLDLRLVCRVWLQLTGQGDREGHLTREPASHLEEPLERSGESAVGDALEAQIEGRTRGARVIGYLLLLVVGVLLIMRR